MARVAFIGNFGVSFSTESDRAWSLEKLGHQVIRYQENRTTKEQLLTGLSERPWDLLLYSHTHGWGIPGLVQVFNECRRKSVPTASIHLDRWCWLEREKDVGTEATWFTEYQFMADASPEAVELYEKHDLNWHHLKPGVIERDCYLAEADHHRFPHQVIFLGSKGYHPEYPFRPRLIEWLAETYKDQFGHYGGDGLGTIREKDLNVLLASAAVVVGDSCFGGRPNYVSDRYYEVPGRGGFLIHPWVDEQTTENPGVSHYAKENMLELMEKIDWFLAADDARERMRRKGQEWVNANGTYTHRMQEMLEVVGI